MYLILWEYEVRPEALKAFVDAYGADGAWARLFRRASGFVGVELLRNEADGGQFVTIDRWLSRADFEAFRAAFAHAYEALDAELGALTESERRIGAFEVP